MFNDDSDDKCIYNKSVYCKYGQCKDCAQRGRNDAYLDDGQDRATDGLDNNGIMKALDGAI